MTLDESNLKEYRYGFTNTKKRIGINNWRFFFNGVNVISGSEQIFFLEFDMINPWDSPSEVKLSFKPNPKLTERDLQYALAGTESAKSLKTEGEINPSYCLVRFGKLGQEPKQLCAYFPVKKVTFNNRPFSIEAGDILFSESNLKGNIDVSEDKGTYKLEYLCNQGTAEWDLCYDIAAGYSEGYDEKARWFPCGLTTYLAGRVSFDGVSYIVNKDNCFGYCDRYWGKTLPEPWFHISSNTLTSEITGTRLFNSAFAVQGLFDDKISFIGKIENEEIIFRGEKSKSKFETAWTCVQSPESENDELNTLHWSCSFTSKTWIVDIDVYCKLKDLFNRKIELPDGPRKTLELVEGISSNGEIKIYKQYGSTIEQVEHAKLDKVVCEFGCREEYEF